MILDPNVFGSSVRLRISDLTNSWLVIFKNLGWSSRGISYICQQLSHPDFFLCCTCQCNVLGFRSRKCYTWLFLSSPADCCTTDLEHISWCWVTIIRVSSSVSTTVSNTATLSIFSVKESQGQSPLQVAHDPFNSSPVLFGRTCTKLGHVANSIRNIWSCHYWQVQKTTNCRLKLDSPQLSSQVSSWHLLACGLAWHSPFQISAGLFWHKFLDRSTLLQSVGSKSP